MSVPTIRNFQVKGDAWTCEYYGKAVNGVILMPVGDGPFPAVVINHPVGMTAEQFARKVREFVKLGYVCIGPEYTHVKPQSDRALVGASPENIRRAKACVDMLRGMPFVEPDRIYAYGHSHGALVAIGLATEMSDKLAAVAITGGGVAPNPGTPMPTVGAAQRIRAPMLILQGANDRILSPDRSALLKSVLDRNRVPNDRQVFDGADNVLLNAKSAEAFNLIEAWFTKYDSLKAQTRSVTPGSPAATNPK